MNAEVMTGIGTRGETDQENEISVKPGIENGHRGDVTTAEPLIDENCIL